MKWYVGRWFGYDRRIFVWCLCIGQEGQVMLEEGQGLLGGAVCHFVVKQVFSVSFEEAEQWCACPVMATGYCLLVHARLCSVQRILPHSWCGQNARYGLAAS